MPAQISLTPPPKAEADEEVVRGWSGVELDKAGIKQAHEIGRSLKGRGIKLFICSDLPRAVETTEILSKESGAPVTGKSADLRTWGLGELEGSGLKDSEKIIRYYLLEAPNDAPKGGESANRFVRRAIRKVSQIMDISITSGVIVGIVTHHWVVTLIQLWVEAGCPPDFRFDRARLLTMKEDPPGTVYDMRLTKGKWSMPRVPAGTDFHPGPVMIRHEQTKMN